MKSIVTALTVVLLTCGVASAQAEPGPGFEHLKGFESRLGTWRYEGPLLEDVPGIAEKATDFVFEFSWRRILNKNVVEEKWLCEFEGGITYSGKALIGWNAAEKRITYGSMDSDGGMSLGTIDFDAESKSSTLTEKGTDGEGKETSVKGVVIKTGKDTITWQALERTGGIAEGPSPIYTFKRVKGGKKVAK